MVAISAAALAAAVAVAAAAAVAACGCYCRCCRCLRLLLRSPLLLWLLRLSAARTACERWFLLLILDESKGNDVGRTGAKSSGGASWPLRAYQGNPFTKYSKMLAPAGILRELFYNIFQKIAHCGHIKGALLQSSQNSRRVGRVVSRRSSCLHFYIFYIFTLFILLILQCLYVLYVLYVCMYTDGSNETNRKKIMWR